MPLARCWHYDEKGSAINGGCKLNSCSFVHPGDPDWDRAPPSNRRRLTTKGGDVTRKSSSSSWGKPPPVPLSKSSSWDTGGRNTSKESRRTSDLASRKADNSWNTTRDKKTSSEKAEWGNNIASAWGIDNDTPSKKSTTESSWTSWTTGNDTSSRVSTTTESAWSSWTTDNDLSSKESATEFSWSSWTTDNDPSSKKSTTESSWSSWTAPESDSKSSDGWSGWDKRQADETVNPWGQESKSSGLESWSSSGADRPEAAKSKSSGLGWGDPKSFMATSKDSGRWSRDSVGGEPSRKTGYTNNESERGRASDKSDFNMSWEESSANKLNDAVKIRGRPPGSSDANDNSGGEFSSMLTKAPNNSLAPDASNASIVTHMKFKISSRGQRRFSGKQSTSKSLLRRAKGPKARALLYASMIKHTLNAVRFEVALLRAEDETARWKRTALSKLYSRATPATRVKFDSIRQAYGRKVVDAMERRDRALETLVALPILEKPSNHRNSAYDKERIMSYTAELRNWITDLQLHRRIRCHTSGESRSESKMRIDEHMLESSSGAPAAPSTAAPQEAAMSGIELKNRGTWSWAEIRQAMAALETKAQGTSEEIDTGGFTKFSEVEDLHQHVSELATKAVAEVRKRRMMIGDSGRAASIAALAAKTTSAGSIVEVQAKRTADLYTKIRERQEVLKKITADNEAAQRLCKEAEERIAESWKVQEIHEREVEDLTNQIRNLHTHERKPHRSRQLKRDDIKACVQSIAEAQVEREAVPILETLRKQCESHIQQLEMDVQKRSEPILRITEAIRRKAQEGASAA